MSYERLQVLRGILVCCRGDCACIRRYQRGEVLTCHETSDRPESGFVAASERLKEATMLQYVALSGSELVMQRRDIYVLGS